MKRVTDLILNFGTKANDTIVGTASAEKIFGYKGHDVLIGGAGDDRLNGGGGDDYISGNQGNDILRGGRGADTFVFDGDFDADLVRDFNACQDDALQFVLYQPEAIDWTAETLLGMCAQSGKDVVLAIADTDERVTFKNLTLDHFDASDFEVIHYQAEGVDLLA